MDKDIGDTAWNQLVQHALYKPAKTNRACVMIGPRSTSQECSGCDKTVREAFSHRVHNYPHFRCVLDKGVIHAPLNILGGLKALGESPRSSFPFSGKHRHV